MTDLDDQFQEHAVHTTLDNLTQLLNEEVFVSEDLAVVSQWTRITQAAAYAKGRFGRTVPGLANIGHLNKANNALQNIINEVNSYKSSKDIAHLNNTSNHIDALLGQLAPLPLTDSALANETFSDTFAEFSKHAGKIIEQLSAQGSEVAATVDALAQKLSDLDGARATLQEEIEACTAGAKAVTEEFRGELTALREATSTQIDKAIGAIEARYESLESSFEERHEAHQENQRAYAELAISELEGKKQQASDLVQIIGNIGITGNYQNIANQEKDSADRWRNIALALMLAMVGAIAITLYTSVSNGFDWKLALFRLLATLVLAIPATYAARESARHRSLESATEEGNWN